MLLNQQFELPRAMVLNWFKVYVAVHKEFSLYYTHMIIKNRTTVVNCLQL